MASHIALYSDASLDAGEAARCAWVLRYGERLVAEGRCLLGPDEPHRHQILANSTAAEYWGALVALRRAGPKLPRDVNTLTLYLDNETVVAVLRFDARHPEYQPGLRALAAEVLAASYLLPCDVLYSWIPREQNRYADRLAARGREFVYEPPPVAHVAARPAPGSVRPSRRFGFGLLASKLSPLMAELEGEGAHEAP
jgi:probable phosphoglycerate mutase